MIALAGRPHVRQQRCSQVQAIVAHMLRLCVCTPCLTPDGAASVYLRQAQPLIPHTVAAADVELLHSSCQGGTRIKAGQVRPSRQPTWTDICGPHHPAGAAWPRLRLGESLGACRAGWGLMRCTQMLENWPDSGLKVWMQIPSADRPP